MFCYECCYVILLYYAILHYIILYYIILYYIILYYIILYYIILYHIILLRDHRRICGPSLTETSLCGAYLYLVPMFRGCGAILPLPLYTFKASTSPFYTSRSSKFCLAIFLSHMIAYGAR